MNEQQRAQLEYLKLTHPESVPAIEAAQGFIDAMVAIQTRAGHSQEDLKELKGSIMALAKEQEA